MHDGCLSGCLVVCLLLLLPLPLPLPLLLLQLLLLLLPLPLPLLLLQLLLLLLLPLLDLNVPYQFRPSSATGLPGCLVAPWHCEARKDGDRR